METRGQLAQKVQEDSQEKKDHRDNPVLMVHKESKEMKET